MRNGEEHKNLTNFLKFFINRPNHLARYLIDHNALNSKFLDTLKDKEQNKEFDKQINIYFLDINQMNNFFDSLVNKKNKSESRNFEDLKNELNKELENCIKEERYEDAIRIRDYLKKICKDKL